MLVACALHQADLHETRLEMKRDRGRARTADDGHHLTEAEGGAAVDQLTHQRLADALTAGFGRQVDRILHHPAIGRAGAEGRGIGVAEEVSVVIDGGDIGILLADDRGKTLRHLGLGGRCDLVACNAVQDGVAIDPGNGGDIGFRGVTQKEGHRAVGPAAGQNSSKTIPPKTVQQKGGRSRLFDLDGPAYLRLPMNCSRNMKRLMKSR
ncbi:hypothetical protein RHECNPAF_4460083 [Rhizobium etli CNPAF512]|nr:hypothetical protein RHECNPAF_4460083 [Rhizobium etli CNPAF512]